MDKDKDLEDHLRQLQLDLQESWHDEEESFEGWVVPVVFVVVMMTLIITLALLSWMG